MAEPFNIEKFRQQRRAQSAEMQQPTEKEKRATLGASMVPLPMPQLFQAGPQSSSAAPQQMPGPMAPNVFAQPQPAMYRQIPPSSGFPQNFAGQHVPEMPPAHQTQPAMLEAPQEPIVEHERQSKTKRSRFSFRRPKKVVTRKLKEVNEDQIGGVVKPTRLVLPFLLGLVSGVVLSVVGLTILSSVMTKKIDQKFEAVAAVISETEPPVGTPEIDESPSLSLNDN